MVAAREICTSRAGNLREIPLRFPDSLVLLNQQISHASQRCAPWGIFFHRLKIISCVFPCLVQHPLVAAATVERFCCVFNSMKPFRVAAWGGFFIISAAKRRNNQPTKK